ELANGLINRFLVIYVQRMRSLPHGGNVDNRRWTLLADRLRRQVDDARKIGQVTLHPDAFMRWEALYQELTTGRAGKLGKATARGAPLVKRLAMIYALLDGERLIASRHLDAAAAVWRYALDSAGYVFGETQFTPLAQKFNAALEKAGSAGLTRTELRELAGSNAIKGATIAKALE